MIGTPNGAVASLPGASNPSRTRVQAPASGGRVRCYAIAMKTLTLSTVLLVLADGTWAGTIQFRHQQIED